MLTDRQIERRMRAELGRNGIRVRKFQNRNEYFYMLHDDTDEYGPLNLDQLIDYTERLSEKRKGG